LGGGPYLSRRIRPWVQDGRRLGWPAIRAAGAPTLPLPIPYMP
jgi:hypothetical protein